MTSSSPVHSTSGYMVQASVPGAGQSGGGGTVSVAWVVVTGRRLALLPGQTGGLDLAQNRADLHQVDRHRRLTQNRVQLTEHLRTHARTHTHTHTTTMSDHTHIYCNKHYYTLLIGLTMIDCHANNCD